MDVGPICHVYKSMKLIKRLNRKILIFQTSNFVANWRYESYGKIQNFSSISIKLCLLGQKKHRDTGCEYHYSKTKYFFMLLVLDSL